MAADNPTTMIKQFAELVNPMGIPCSRRDCNAPVGRVCDSRAGRFHDERWRESISRAFDSSPSMMAGLVVELFGQLPGVAAGAVWQEIGKILDDAIGTLASDPIPTLGQVLETLEANKECTLPALVDALDALGDWHLVIDTAHAVGDWRWVLAAHPRKVSDG